MSHFGDIRTFSTIAKWVYCKDLQQYINYCMVCMKFKSDLRRIQKVSQQIVTGHPLELLFIDII